MRTSASRLQIRCASMIGSGISSSVSTHANPNIIPWSPAPTRSSGSSSPGVVLRLVGALHALRDVRRLLVDRDDHAARVRVEAVLGAVVADLLDAAADEPRDVHVALRRDLARHDHEPGRDERLAGHAAVRVVREDGVENCVRDLVGDLVGVAFGDRLGREEEAPRGHVTAKASRRRGTRRT